MCDCQPVGFLLAPWSRGYRGLFRRTGVGRSRFDQGNKAHGQLFRVALADAEIGPGALAILEGGIDQLNGGRSPPLVVRVLQGLALFQTESALGMLPLKLGRSLAWDGHKEEVPGDAETKRLLSRHYRQGWEYPT
jgi:hypothetical protein